MAAPLTVRSRVLSQAQIPLLAVSSRPGNALQRWCSGLIAKILINSLKLMYRNYSVNLTLMVVPFYNSLRD